MLLRELEYARAASVDEADRIADLRGIAVAGDGSLELGA